MRRWIVAALLLLCLPVVGRGQSIRYYPDSTSYTLGKTESGILYRAASANPTLLDGLVSYWTLDEASGTRADSVGSNDLTDNNTVGAVPRGPEGTVANLLAANSEYLSSADPSLDLTGDFTYAIWYKQQPPDAALNMLMGNDPAGSRGIMCGIDGGDQLLDYWYITEGANYNHITYSIGEGVYSHVWRLAWFWREGSTMYCTKNTDDAGKASGAIVGSVPYTGEFWIGRAQTGYGNIQTGPIGVWSRALTAQERADVFAQGNSIRYADLPASLLTGLVSYWHLDEVSGVRYDSHGSNDLTDNNTVGSVINAGDAMDGAAASFVAANSEKLNRTGVNFGFTDFSISLWAKTPVSAAAYQEYVCKNNTIDFDLRSYDANYVQFNVNGSSAQIQTDTNWHLIVAYYVHSEKKAYLTIDAGVPTAGAAGTGLSETTSELAIGAATSSYNNNGLIDEVAIWDRVLTSDRITELWNAGAGVYYPTFQ